MTEMYIPAIDDPNGYLRKGYNHILLTSNFDKFRNYDKLLLSESGYTYSSLIKRDQKVLLDFLVSSGYKYRSIYVICKKYRLGELVREDLKLVSAYEISDYSSEKWSIVGQFNKIKRLYSVTMRSEIGSEFTCFDRTVVKRRKINN